MSITAGFNCDYVFELALQLSPEERERLLQKLANGDTSESDSDQYCPEKFCELLLRGPVIDEEHIQLMLDAREEVNRCRPILW